MKKQGAYALIMVLVMTALAALFIISAWFIAGFQFDIVDQREQWHKHFYATEAGLKVGLAYVKDNFDGVHQLMSKQKKLPKVDLYQVLEMCGCNKNNAKADLRLLFGVEKLTSSQYPDALLVRAELWQETVCCCTLKAIICKELMRTEKGQEKRFVVRHFTIDSTV